MKEMKKTKRRGLTAALLFCSSLLSFGQQDNEQFSIATLNVDGLPQKVLVVKINTNGPGDTGSARIGKYLAKKDYDLVMMQEDFNYHGTAIPAAQLRTDISQLVPPCRLRRKLQPLGDVA